MTRMSTVTPRAQFVQIRFLMKELPNEKQGLDKEILKR